MTYVGCLACSSQLPELVDKVSLGNEIYPGRTQEFNHIMEHERHIRSSLSNSLLTIVNREERIEPQGSQTKHST